MSTAEDYSINYSPGEGEAFSLRAFNRSSVESALSKRAKAGEIILGGQMRFNPETSKPVDVASPSAEVEAWAILGGVVTRISRRAVISGQDLTNEYRNMGDSSNNGVALRRRTKIADAVTTSRGGILIEDFKPMSPEVKDEDFIAMRRAAASDDDETGLIVAKTRVIPKDMAKLDFPQYHIKDEEYGGIMEQVYALAQAAHVLEWGQSIKPSHLQHQIVKTYLDGSPFDN